MTSPYSGLNALGAMSRQIGAPILPTDRFYGPRVAPTRMETDPSPEFLAAMEAAGLLPTGAIPPQGGLSTGAAPPGVVPPMPAPREIGPPPGMNMPPVADIGPAPAPASLNLGMGAPSLEAPEQPSFWEQIRSSGMLQDLFLGLAMGSDFNDSIAKAGLMMAQGRDRRRGEGDLGSLRQAAISAGVAPEIANRLPANTLADLVQRVEQERLTATAAPATDDMREFQFAQQNGFDGSFVDWMNRASGGSAPSSVQEYEYARQNGYEGSFQEWMQTGRNNAGGIQPPSGYLFNDPANPAAGVTPIPGGPGEAISAELSGRLGIANSFLGQAPALREQLAAGGATGWVDRAFAAFPGSDQAGIERQMASGIDALIRMLSGAGLPQAEAEQYAERYRLGMGDTAESAVAKLDQLTRELEEQIRISTRGRGSLGPVGGSPTGGSTPSDNDPLGIL